MKSTGTSEKSGRSHKRDRRRAREAALQILYHWDIAHTDTDEAARTLFGPQWPDAAPPDEALRQFASDLARDTVAGLEPIDRLIAATSEHWRPERMAVIDRLILRMAVCELRRGPETPPAVVINEALELARRFSTEDSVKFINGILDAVRRKLQA